ncbi:MAG: 1-acyl-sn-glycerol-3-phosphate acyltransferase [Bacteroidia bacterium]|jgi:1-acyl-sn-glycerol-3-phosphate acyltransferase
MGRILQSIYLKTLNFKWLWLFGFAFVFVVMGWLASQIHIEEDITKTFPRTEEFKKYDNLYRNSSISGNIIVAIGPLSKSTSEELVVIGENLLDRFYQLDTVLFKSIQFDANSAKLEQAYDEYLRNLPYFLTTSEIDSMFSQLSGNGVSKRLSSTLNRLRSYESLGTKRFLMKDPLQIGSPILGRLSKLEEGNTFKIVDGYTFTADGEYLLMVVKPSNPPTETVQNTFLVEGLQTAVDSVSAELNQEEILLFGGPVIAVGNASRIKKDTKLVSILSGVFIFLLLTGYFKNIVVPILFFVPAVFGLTFALAVISVTQGSISAISVAVGTIVLGIAIDYSFHFFNHYRETGSIEETLKEVSSPLLLGCATTVAAFFSLNFLRSDVLADFGTFAGLSLIGTAFFALLGLPHIAGLAKFRPASKPKPSTPLKFKWKALGFVSLLGATIFLWNYADEVQFENDLNKINYFPEHLQKAQAIIVGNSDRESLFILSADEKLSEAVEKSASLRDLPSLRGTKQSVSYEQIASGKNPRNDGQYTTIKSTVLTDIVPTPTQINERVEVWNKHIINLKESIESKLSKAGSELGFQPQFLQVYETVFREYETADEQFYENFLLNDPIYSEFVFKGDDGFNVVSTVNLPKNQRAEFTERVEAIEGLETIARSSLAQDLVNTVSEDLNFILILSSLLVFVVLLLTYGRLELAIVTFLPMAVSWVWILGICGLFDIKFNMINVVVTTFIFGLGDDYSIFISDGILSRYKYGIDKTKTYRNSIILSAITTIIGTGVLIFSKHPALHSIALLSVTGMICVVIASLTLQPLLYDILIDSRKKRGFSPLETIDFLRAALAFGWFLIGCGILSVCLLILILLPIKKRTKQHVMMTLISKFIKSDYQTMFHVPVRWLNKDPLDKPAIMIANHSSFVDLMMLIGSSNKLLLVTNDWVWNSPLFGAFIRYVEYIHAKDETSFDLDKIREKVDQGYSVLIFPEGTRSKDGRIGRFKKGAFYLAEELKLDILPVVLHGIHHALRKGDFSVQDSYVTLKYLPRIEPDDESWGVGYRERSKSISTHFKAEFETVRSEVEGARFFADKVQRLYSYKGPVLEWYVSIKMKLENNFKEIVNRVPKNGKVYDLGCGYGYLSHLLAMQSFDRHVVGLDYDEEKILLAENTHYAVGNLEFAQMDLTKFQPEEADCFIIKDVLHYFPASEQEALLNRCGEKLHTGGTIIIRDGIEDEKEKHGVTKMTEVFSTKVFGFNKTEHELEFLPEKRVLAFAEKFNLSVERFENKASSNVTFVLIKKP